VTAGSSTAIAVPEHALPHDRSAAPEGEVKYSHTSASKQQKGAYLYIINAGGQPCSQKLQNFHQGFLAVEIKVKKLVPL